MEGGSASLALSSELENPSRLSAAGEEGSIVDCNVDVSSHPGGPAGGLGGDAVGDSAGGSGGSSDDGALVVDGATSSSGISVVVVGDSVGSIGGLKGAQINKASWGISDVGLDSLSGGRGHSEEDSSVNQVADSGLAGGKVGVQSGGGVVVVVVVDELEEVGIGDTSVGLDESKDGSLVGGVALPDVGTDEGLEEGGDVSHVVVVGEPGGGGDVAGSLVGAEVLRLLGKGNNGVGEEVGGNVVLHGGSDDGAIQLTSGNEVQAVVSIGDEGVVGDSIVVQDLAETSHETGVNRVDDDVLVAQGSNRVPSAQNIGVSDEVETSGTIGTSNN